VARLRRASRIRIRPDPYPQRWIRLEMKPGDDERWPGQEERLG
jgi:hypothetical protein